MSYRLQSVRTVVLFVLVILQSWLYLSALTATRKAREQTDEAIAVAKKWEALQSQSQTGWERCLSVVGK